MLDALFGRAELKERIAELEDEKRGLERQLEAERGRRADAVSERQAAQQRANRLEDRIADLEGVVDRLEDEERTLSPRRRTTLRGGRVGAVLDRLESVEAAPEGAFTAYVPDGSDLPGGVREAFGERAALVGRAAPCLAVADDAGLVSVTLSVPDPPDPFAAWGEEFVVEREWFEPGGRFTLALVRSDLFAMAEYEDGERTGFLGFEDDLGENHSKGGFSQARFERLRDERIEGHLDRCREALTERTTDQLYVVGERTVLGTFEGMATATATVDATGDPEAALADAFGEFWAVRLSVV